MAIKVTCTVCNKEIWDSLTDPRNVDSEELGGLIQTTPISEAIFAVCSDCLLTKQREYLDKGYSPDVAFQLMSDYIKNAALEKQREKDKSKIPEAPDFELTEEEIEFEKKELKEFRKSS